MESAAKLITALASLLAALAWPAVFLAIMLIFRQQIRDGLAKFPGVVDRVKALKIGAMEAELEKIAESSGRETGGDKGLITDNEVSAAVKIKADAKQIGNGVLLGELDKLCTEYDTIRRVMPAGDRRTRAMTQILVRMRALGLSLSDHIEVYKSSGSSGSRLAAVAMMQIQPQKVDLDWLVRRFREDHPFIFYHAALALQNAANDPNMYERVRAVSQTALEIVDSFEGESDEASRHVLTSIVEGRESGHYS